MKVEVIPATKEHAASLASRLSADAREDLERGWGVKDPETEIVDAVLHDEGQCWAIMADGEVYGLFALSDNDTAWFLTSKDFERLAFRFVRHCRYYLKRLLGQREKFWNYINADNEKMVRWLQWVGFEVEEPVNGYRRVELCASQFRQS
jgi:hypothetical protein